MGLDRPGITPAPRKKVRRKPAPKPAGGVIGRVAVAVPAAKSAPRRQAPVTSRSVNREIRRAKPVKRGRAGGAIGAVAVGPKADTGNILAGVTQADRLRARGVKVVDLGALKRAQQRRTARINAPILDVLDQTTRPLHGVAGGVDAAITGQNVGRAVKRGLQNKDKTTFSTVLKHAGAPKGVQTALGLPLDIAADPTTYVTFGTGSVARKAVASGLAKEAPKGLTVKVAGREVPAVRKATGHTIGRAAHATGRARPVRAVRRVVADVNPNMAPEGVSKAAWQRATHAARSARGSTAHARREAQARAVSLRKAMGKDDDRVTHAIETKTIGGLPAHLQGPARELDRLYREMDVAEKAAGIKGGTIREMTPRAIPARVAPARVDAAEVAHAKAVLERRRLESATDPATRSAREAAQVRAARAQAAHLGREARAARQADVAERVAIKQATRHNARIAGAPKAYVPHKTVESITGKPPKGQRGSVGRRKIAPDARKTRQVQGTLAAKVAAEPGKYSRDAALVYANRGAESGHAIAQAQLNHELVRLGRPYKSGQAAPDPKTEGVFRLDGADLQAVTGSALRTLERNGPRPGEQVVILPHKLIEHAHAVARGTAAPTATGRAFDRAQGAFKLVAISTPAFHVRNLVGDTHNAYLGQAGHRLPGNLVRSGRTLRALKRTEEAQRTLGAVPKAVKGSRGVKIDGKHMTYEQLAEEASRVGAIRSGYQNREITDQLATKASRGATVRKVSGDTRRGHVARSVKRTLQSREDLPRLATYIHARRQGMSAQEAAAFEMRYHFDYANLTPHERAVMRRIAPFYVFSSRNIPLQLKSILTNPGKFANYQKLREEAAVAVGLQPGWEGDLTPFEQRNAPIPVRIKGRLYTVSMGLPITDLNEFPTTADALALASEQAQKLASLATPLLKDPVEIYANRSLFFRDDIRRENAPIVPAPTWTRNLSPAWKKRLGVVDDLIDKRTGRRIMGWDAWSNYAAHVVPGLPALGLKLSGPTDRLGHDRTQQAIGATGVKVTPIDPASVRVNDLYDELDRLRTRLGALSQRGIKAGSPERDRLNARVRVLERRIYDLSPNVVKPTQGKPRKVRLPSPSYGATGGLGAGGSGGAGLPSGGLGGGG